MEEDDVQHSPSLFSSAYATQEEGKFPSQPKHNPINIHEVEVQDDNSSNMLE